MTIEYHEAAADELRDEFVYLEKTLGGLGQRFLAEVKQAEVRILEFPRAAPEVAQGIRGKMLPSFPFTIFYSIEEGLILVLAVSHHKRRPKYWLDRLDPPTRPDFE